MASDLNQVLGLEPSEEVAERGISMTKTVRVEDTLEFRDLRLVVIRVNENNVIDELDDSVELVVNTPLTSQDMTIEEFRSEFIDDYEVSVPDIKPSGRPGYVRAKITIRYLPPPGTVQAPVEATPTPAPDEAVDGGALSIDEIEALNALLIRYKDPGNLLRWLIGSRRWIYLYSRSPLKSVLSRSSRAAPRSTVRNFRY